MQAETGKRSKKGNSSLPKNNVLSAFDHTLYIEREVSFEDFCQSLIILAASANDNMETSKNRPVSSTVMFSSIFLSVLCFAGLIHVEIELHVHRQMIQALIQQREEKLELRNTANDENESVIKMLQGDSMKGESVQ